MNLDRIQQALDRSGNTHSVSDVLAMADAGTANIIDTDDATVVYQIVTYPLKRFAHIWLAAGAIDEVIRIGEWIIDRAKDAGFDGVTVDGRIGWKRALKEIGFESKGVSLVRSF